MSPPPGLLEMLTGSRFVIDMARPSVGLGERRSSAHGAGLEFSNYRPYQEGDDLRHLDLRVRARLGENYIRQYSVDRQLPVAILFDVSLSMAQGTPEKFAFAQMLVQTLGFVALTGGDRVQIGVLSGDELAWSPRFQGLARAELMFDWVGEQKSSGTAGFGKALRTASSGIPAGSLVILVSDWWCGDITGDLARLAGHRHELVAIHVESPEELDPSVLGEGLIRLNDAETGEEVELLLDSGTLDDYRRLHAEWTATLQSQFARWHGRYFRVGSAADLSEFMLRRLRGAGVLT